jgi:pimeloyl-ACP methyl ester carboxylesterase
MVAERRRLPLLGSADVTSHGSTVERTTVTAGGFELSALTAGAADAPLVVLLHGFPQSSRCWEHALHTLADAGYRVVAPDQRGYSPAANPHEIAAYRIDELVGDVIDIAGAWGRRRFHIVGHDWGGTVAWAVAAEHPNRVASLTAVSTPHTAALARALRRARQRARMAYIPVLQLPWIGEAAFERLGGALAVQALVAAGLPRDIARRDVAAMRAVGPRGPLNWYRALRLGGAPRAKSVQVPTLYVWSTCDVAFGREAAELTERHVNGPYHFVELRGASHWIPDLHWDDTADLVLEHLRATP